MEAIKKIEINKIGKVILIAVSYERERHKIDEIINKVRNAGMEIYDISTDEGNLEDVFVDLTKS